MFWVGPEFGPREINLQNLRVSAALANCRHVVGRKDYKKDYKTCSRMSARSHSADVVLNILARHRDPEPPATIATPEVLSLRHAPIADCARYDRLRRVA